MTRSGFVRETGGSRSDSAEDELQRGGPIEYRQPPGDSMRNPRRGASSRMELRHGSELERQLAASSRRVGRPTEKEALLKSDQILQAAQDLFLERGFRAVTMRMVAEKAGVSSRTVYNRFAEKSALFHACTDLGAAGFPKLQPSAGSNVAATLRQYAAELFDALSLEPRFRIAALVFREGHDFPELLRTSESVYERHIIRPLAVFFRETNCSDADPLEMARLFVAMALYNWQLHIRYRKPRMTHKDVERHCAFVVGVFTKGLKLRSEARERSRRRTA